MFLAKILSQISLKYRERSTERPNQNPTHFYGMRNRFVL